MWNEAAGPSSYFRKAVEGESEEECIGRSSMDVLEYLGWESHKMDSGLH